jgi:hypothetical protein
MNFSELTKDDKRFLLLGVKHTYDSSDPQMGGIKTIWQEFLATSLDSPKVAVVEHQPSDQYFVNEEQAIKEGGEVGLVSFLAHSTGVDIICPEPDRKSQVEFLTKKLPKDDIAYYFFCRPASQWHRLQDPKPPLNSYIEPYIQRDKALADWPDFDYSYDHLSNIHQTTIGKTVEETTAPEWTNLINPFQATYPTNVVVKALHDHRNSMILENIKKSIDAGNSLFIVYGSGHFETLKKGIEALI